MKASMSSTLYLAFPAFPSRSGRKIRTQCNSLALDQYRPMLDMLISYRAASVFWLAHTALSSTGASDSLVSAFKRSKSHSVQTRADSTLRGAFPLPSSISFTSGLSFVEEFIPEFLSACVLQATLEPWQDRIGDVTHDEALKPSLCKCKAIPAFSIE